jgi:hypothetical protein
MARVTKASAVEFMVHDLRRTFITTAESLDISAYALKRLLYGKMPIFLNITGKKNILEKNGHMKKIVKDRARNKLNLLRPD